MLHDRSISQHISARLVHSVEEGEVQLRTVSDFVHKQAKTIIKNTQENRSKHQARFSQMYLSQGQGQSLGQGRDGLSL